MSHDHNHDMDEEMSCPMNMVFHYGNCETLLFTKWTVTQVGTFVASAIGVLLCAVFYEGLKHFRELLYIKAAVQEERSRLQKQSDNEEIIQSNTKSITEMMLNHYHIIQSLLHIIQVAISYLLMLIVMTFNIWIFIVIILGAGLGYFLFGWKRNSVSDVTEHCH